MTEIYEIIFTCPWCGRGETLADKPAAANISCRCHDCGRFYNIDLKNQRVAKAAPKSKARAPCQHKKSK